MVLHEPHAKWDAGPPLNFTSALREASSEVKLVDTNDDEIIERPRRVRAGDLQRQVRERGISQIEYYPLMGMDGYWAVGLTTMIAAYPKTGKTELTWQNLLVLGEPALYFSEEPQQIWEIRLSLIPDGAADHIDLVFAMGMQAQEIVNEQLAFDGKIVVIDSVRDVIQPEDENDNASVARALRPHIEICRKKNQALLLLHHTSKNGGEHGKGITGAHAFLGTVDVALEILPVEGKENQRRITGRGRINEIQDLIYEKRGMEYVALGRPNEVTAGEVQKLVMRVMKDQYQTTKDIYKLASCLVVQAPSEDSVLAALKALASKGEVVREPPMSVQRVQGKTVQWALSGQSELHFR